MENVVTASGRAYACDYFNPFSPTRQLNIRVLGATIGELSPVFADPAETATLTCEQVMAEGYTNLVAIMRDNNAVRIVLEKE